MQTRVFVAIVIFSGALAGLVQGSANFILVEPYLDQAIEIENLDILGMGGTQDEHLFWAEQESYRMWQKNGQLIASMFLGISFGSLFGAVFAMSRRALPARDDIRRALMLSGIMWFTIYLVPFLKYPAAPPGIGDPDTVTLRIVMYLLLVALSGLSTLGFYKLSKRLQNRRKLLALVGYAAFMIVVFVAMPDFGDENSVLDASLAEFRMATILGVSTFWISVGLILGILWNHYKPHRRMASYN